MSVHRDRVRITREGDVAYVTLIRADKHNALDWDMLNALVEAAAELRADRRVRGAVIHGEGGSFCSGLDFPQFTKQPTRLARAFAKLTGSSTNLFQEACWAFRNLPIPVAAVLHGRCYGGGLQLALAADFRFAEPSTELSILEAKWGLIPDMTGSVTLSELLPMDVAKRLTMTGEMFDAEAAKGYGLVTEVTNDPMGAAEALLATIAARSPDSVAATKRLFHESWTASEERAFSLETWLQAKVLAGKNQRAAMKSNFAKKPPRFGPRGRAVDL